MKKFFFLCFTFFLCLSLHAEINKIKQPAKVLIFSKTLGFRHKSITDGINAIQKMATENNFVADTTENPGAFTTQNLKQYKAVIFLSPTGEFFNDDQKSAFQQYIRSGGGFIGIHAATDCLFKWEWYGKMIGAYFTDHPPVQEAALTIIDTKHLSTKNLVSPWNHTDEWYNFNYTNPNVNVLLKLDEGSYKGGKNGANHPVAWYHQFEGGRVFYTALGHTPESFSNEYFLKHLLGGIKYAAQLK